MEFVYGRSPMWVVQEWIFANSMAFTVEKTIYSANVLQMDAVLARHETIHVTFYL